MNILPKKRWHVRTKENIARVRRDEALAAEQAKIEQTRIEKAESEARINFLRTESRKKNNTAASDLIDLDKIPNNCKTPAKHINFFEELEQGNIDYSRPNKEHEKDKKEEQEKYEKQIGYLTYLGQGVKEAVSKSWYNELPKRLNDSDKTVEIKPNKKALEDPIQDIKRYLNIITVKKEKSRSIIKLEKSLKTVSTINDTKQQIVENLKKRKHKSSTDEDSNEDKIRSHKHSKKHKRTKKSKKHKREREKVIEKEIKRNFDIEKLRAERLEREKRERLRTQALLSEMKDQHSSEKESFCQKYNSQFFPELARQNCEKSYR